jgi:ParB family chromosome partitioning protein
MAGLAAALAGSQPEQRYAAALTLLFRSKPIRYFIEAQRAGSLRSLAKPWIPETLPQGLYRDEELEPEKSWLRRLFSGDSPNAPKTPAAPTSAEQNLLRRLAFGAYMGLLRQVTGDEESHRVRRDSVDRVVELGLQFIGVPAAIPPIVRALDDPNHLVRRAAFQGLKKLLAPDTDAPLTLALGSTSADVGRLSLDEWAERGASAKPRIVAALNARLPEVRKYAFDLLEKLSGEGSFEPLLAALASDFSDLRLGVIERLASSDDPRVVAALTKALESDHDDLRLRSAELLAQRRQDLSTSVLGTFLRSENEAQRERAIEALTPLASIEAVRTLGARLEDADEALTTKLVEALGATRNPDAIDVLTGLFSKDSESLRAAAFSAAMNVVGEDRKKRQDEVTLRLFRRAVVAKDPALRKAAAAELDAVKNPEANDLLWALPSHRCRKS